MPFQSHVHPDDPRTVIVDSTAGAQPWPSRPEPTEAEREAAREANMLSFKDAKKLFKSEDAFTWMLERGLLGQSVRGTKQWSALRITGLGAIVRPPVQDYLLKDAVEAGLAKVREIAKSIR